MKMQKVIIPFILSLYFLIGKISSQSEPINELTQNKSELGYIKEDDGHNFYKFVIPSGIQIDTKNLIIRVKEPVKSEKGENFSDPDIYVSKVKIIL
jgi:hypothetical protein